MHAPTTAPWVRLPLPEREIGTRPLLNLGGRLPVAMVAACPFPAERGTPIRVLQMGQALQRIGCEIHVVTYHLGSNKPLPGLKLHRTRALPFYRDFTAGPNYTKLLLLDPLLVMKLARVVRRYRIRILHAHHLEGALAALIVKSFIPGLKVIYDAHTTLADELLDYSFPVPRILKHLATAILDSGIPHLSDHVVTVSDNLRAAIMAHGIPAERVTTIPMSINSQEFLPIPKDEARMALGISAQPMVLYTGGVARFQGIDLLMAAMQVVHQRAPEVRLKIVGQPTKHYCQMVVQKGLSDCVELVGEKPFQEVRRYLAAADLLVLPRRTCVGFPLKLLNYMAAGKPIVAQSDSVGHVLHHLESSYLVQKEGPEALARGILHCLSHPQLASRLGDAARRAVAPFNEESVTQKVRLLYQALLPPLQAQGFVPPATDAK